MLSTPFHTTVYKPTTSLKLLSKIKCIADLFTQPTANRQDFPQTEPCFHSNLHTINYESIIDANT